jgi:hypothetical protein
VNEQGQDKLFKLPYKFTVATLGDSEMARQRKLFDTLELFYRALRQGINYPHLNFYFKSLVSVFAYKKLGQQWDKKTVRENYFEVPFQTDKDILIKDFFGLATEESWHTYNDALVSKESDKAERFKSPLLLKPIKLPGKDQFRVYIDYGEIPREFREASFKVKKNGTGDLVLKPSQTFTWKAFFDYAFKEIDLDAHVTEFNRPGTSYETNPLYTETLQPIFNEIRENLT